MRDEEKKSDMSSLRTYMKDNHKTDDEEDMIQHIYNHWRIITIQHTHISPNTAAYVKNILAKLISRLNGSSLPPPAPPPLIEAPPPLPPPSQKRKISLGQG
jgi:hypothetical protein